MPISLPEVSASIIVDPPTAPITINSVQKIKNFLAVLHLDFMRTPHFFFFGFGSGTILPSIGIT